MIPVIQEITKVIQALTAWFSDLSPEVKKVITIIAMLVIGAAKLVPIIMSIVNTMSMLSIASGGAKIGMLAAAKSIALHGSSSNSCSCYCCFDSHYSKMG